MSKVFLKELLIFLENVFFKIARNMEDLDFIVLFEMPINFQLLQFTPLKLGFISM